MSSSFLRRHTLRSIQLRIVSNDKMGQPPGINTIRLFILYGNVDNSLVTWPTGHLSNVSRVGHTNSSFVVCHISLIDLVNNQRKAGELLSTDQHRSPYHYAPIGFSMVTYTTLYLTGRQRAHTGHHTSTLVFQC